MPQINLPVTETYFYMLSYQGNTHVYAKLNLKRELARIILQHNFQNLRSYTDSSIIFENGPTSQTFNALKNAINAFTQAFRPIVYFTLVRVSKIQHNASLIYTEGDTELNAHFQEMLEDL